MEELLGQVVRYFEASRHRSQSLYWDLLIELDELLQSEIAYKCVRGVTYIQLMDGHLEREEEHLSPLALEIQVQTVVLCEISDVLIY